MFEQRQGRGGGKVYIIDALPEGRGAVILLRLQRAAPQSLFPTAPHDLVDWRCRRLDTRLAIRDRIEAQALGLGSHRKARKAFVARAKAGLLDDPFPRLLAEATARRGEPGAR